MDVKNVIQKQLQEIVKKLTDKQIEIQLSIPKDITHGDFTTNVAFQVGKLSGKSPMEAAKEIAQEWKIGNEELGIVNKVEAVAPGFINFYLSQETLLENLAHIRKYSEEKTLTKSMSGKKVSVEFTDPNPFKEFHIGHVYTNTVGEAMSRLFEANGAVVHRADYFGDVGMHIAKSLYGLEKMFVEDHFDIEDLAKKHLEDRIIYFGKAYAKGSTLYEESPQAQEEMKHINKLIYIAAQRMWKKEKGIEPLVDYKKDDLIDEQKLDRIYKLYTVGREWSLLYFETIYKRLGMKFAGYYPESIAGEKGYQLVKEHISDGTFVENDGAVIFPGEDYGLHTRVFINSLGLPTYEAKELGLAPWKYENFPYDLSVILTGSEINEYFKVLIKALSKVKPDLAAKTKHMGHGMVKLSSGRKMSSRTGQIIAGQDVLDEAHDLAKQKITEAKFTNKSINEKDTENIAEQVGIGAIKYSFLKSSIGKDVPFSFEESVNFDGNSGPYLQYTYTRTQSILAKANKESSHQPLATNYNLHPEELQLLRKLYQFPEIVESAAQSYAPNMVCEYLFELSQVFNNFYQKLRILNANNEDEKELRLALTQGVGAILKQGLYLLGIQAPEKM